MIGWFQTRRNRRAERMPVSRTPTRVPEGIRIYAVGDIHGRADLLGKLHHLILADATNASARRIVVYLGDYIDRGLQSREVIDLLLRDPLPGFEAIHLKGNHEAALLDFLEEPNVGPSWMRFGGDATLLSYGVDRVIKSSGAEGFVAAQKKFAALLPEDHLAFFRNLSLRHEEGDYLFVHAGVRPGIALGDQSAEDLMWIRDEFLNFEGDFGRVIVHGHTITDVPIVRQNRIGIDTGAFATGQLTGLVLEGMERRFIST